MLGDEMKKRYLFICGCPRSGTTAMVHLLNQHKSVILGMERYKKYCNKDKIHFINVNSFEPDNFFNLKLEETNIHPKNDLKWSNFYNSLKSKFYNNNEFDYFLIGDKIPTLERFLGYLNTEFQDVKIIFMLRDIYELAASFNARAENPQDVNWGANKNYKKAVTQWNN